MVTACPIQQSKISLLGKGVKIGRIQSLVDKAADIDSVTKLVAIRKTGTYLIYRVDEYLCILKGEAADRFVLILSRKGGLEQGGEFTENELTSIHASGGYNYAVGKEGSGSDKSDLALAGRLLN